MLIGKFYVNDEKCKNPKHYNDYIRYSALQDLRDGLGVTYLYIDSNEETKEELIMGYISLRTSSLVKDMGEQKKFGYPALEEIPREHSNMDCIPMYLKYKIVGRIR